MKHSHIRGRRLLWALALTLLAPCVAGAADTAQTYLFFVFSNPVAGQDAEYNRWYDHEHAPDVSAAKDIVSAQRYVYADVQLREVPLKKPRYLVVYTIRTTNIDAVIADIKNRAKSGSVRQSATYDGPSTQMFIYRMLGTPLKGAGGEARDAKAGPAADYFHVVFGAATPGNDAEFNAWYDQHHLPDMVSSNGFVAGQRGVWVQQQMEPVATPSPYIAVFTMHTSDLAAVIKDQKMGSAPPPAFDREHTFGYTYQAIGPQISGPHERELRGLPPSGG